jgi:hypothetical protein
MSEEIKNYVKYATFPHEVKVKVRIGDKEYEFTAK